MVFCPDCGKEWVIYDSTYYCTCGNVFYAQDVVREVEYIIQLSSYVVEEMKSAQLSRKRREEMSKSSFSNFALNILNKLGIGLGYAASIIDNIVKIIKTLFVH